MQTKIQRWGNSLALRIPRPFALQAGLVENSPVEISVEEKTLKVRLVQRLTLEDLLAQVTEENLHDEVDSGPAQGNEAW